MSSGHGAWEKARGAFGPLSSTQEGVCWQQQPCAYLDLVAASGKSGRCCLRSVLAAPIRHVDCLLSLSLLLVSASALDLSSIT